MSHIIQPLLICQCFLPYSKKYLKVTVTKGEIVLSTIFSCWPFLGSVSQIWGGLHEIVYTLILPISEVLMHILGFVLLLPPVTSQELPASKLYIWEFHEKQCNAGETTIWNAKFCFGTQAAWQQYEMMVNTMNGSISSIHSFICHLHLFSSNQTFS